MELDEWQVFVLRNSLLEKPDGLWAAKEVGLCVARQNGKGEILEARALLGLFLLDEERSLIHSAHEFGTAVEALDRMDARIEDNPTLKRLCKPTKRSHGEEGIYRKDGRSGKLRYKTRTKTAARGFSCDWLALDEAMILPEGFHGNMMPIVSSRANYQIWYTGSAVDQESMEHGVVFARVRDRAMKGGDEAEDLAYFEFSVPFDRPDDIPPSALKDPEVWALANPAMAIRINPSHIALEQRSMGPRQFAVERLSAGDWPRVDGQGGAVISVQRWLALVDKNSAPADPLVFAVDVSPERSAAVAVAGKRDDGLSHVEVMEHKRGTGWLADWLVERVDRHDPLAVLYDEKGPVSSMVPELEDRGVQMTPVNTSEHGQACGLFYDAVDQGTVRHGGTLETVTALKGAAQRPLGDAWAWSRKNSSVDITPLVAVTLAFWGMTQEDMDSGPLMAAW